MRAVSVQLQESLRISTSAIREFDSLGCGEEKRGNDKLSPLSAASVLQGVFVKALPDAIMPGRYSILHAVSGHFFCKNGFFRTIYTFWSQKVHPVPLLS